MKESKVLVLLTIIVILLISGIKFFKNKDEDLYENNLNKKIFLTEDTQILLYFLDADKEKLVEEYRYVSMESIKSDMLKTIVEELIKGPVSTDLVNVIPASTKINSIMQEGNKVIVDFSKEFCGEYLNDSNENLQKIYAVVNTLTEIKEIDEVEIKIEGTVLASKNRL